MEVAEWSSNQIQDVGVALLQLTRHAASAAQMLHVGAVAVLVARTTVPGACSRMVLAVAEHGHEWHRWWAHAHELSWQWLFPRGTMMIAHLVMA